MGLSNYEKLFDFFVDYSKEKLKRPFDMEKHQTLLSNVAKCGKNMNFFEKVIKMGANVNWTNDTGATALMTACKSGNYEMCSRLIELGASQNRHQYTTLLYLCRSGNDNVDILELLLANGADIQQSTRDGSNALHFAARSASVNIVKKLLEIGISVNSVNACSQTPLHSVLNYSGTEKDILVVVKTLVEAGADVNAKNVSGITPLEHASKIISLRKVFKYLNSLQ